MVSQLELKQFNSSEEIAKLKEELSKVRVNMFAQC